jgi:hypothetical protein
MKQFAGGLAVGIGFTLLLKLNTGPPVPQTRDQSVTLSQKVILALDSELASIEQQLLSIQSDLADIQDNCWMQ